MIYPVGKSIEKLGSSRSPMEEKRDKHFCILGRSERFRERRGTLERKGKGINTPQPPTVT